MTGHIVYRRNMPLAVADVIRVYRSSGIKRPVDDADRIERMFAGANLTVSAWDGDTLVGVARALTDFSYCCYLSDIAVDGACQRRGIGKALIDEVRAAIGPECSLILLSAPSAMAYYPELGFSKIENGFVIARSR